MAVTAKWYGLALRDQWGATATDRVDWMTDTIKTTLHTVTYVPDQDTHDYFNDATNELTTTGGYTAGGVTLSTGKSLTYDPTSNETRLDAVDAAWSSATFTSRIGVVWKDSAGASSTDHLISYVDFGADETVSAGTFTIQWDATGVVKVTAA